MRSPKYTLPLPDPDILTNIVLIPPWQTPCPMYIVAPYQSRRLLIMQSTSGIPTMVVLLCCRADPPLGTYVCQNHLGRRLPPLLIIFRIALSLSFFWVLGERDFSPWPDTPIAASCNLLSISPTLLPSFSPYLTPSRVPNHCRLQSSRMTKPPIGTPYHSTPPLPQIAQEKP